MIDLDGPWQVVCTPADFVRWRNNESFHSLVALARVVNSIRFMHYSLLDSRYGDTPADMRQRLNSFMYTGALLFEGVQLSKKLGKHYRHLAAYQEGFQLLHRDPAVERLMANYLKPLRNEAVFHFDVSTVAENLKQMSDPEYVFVRAEGRGAGFTYYELADASALRIVFGARTDADYATRAAFLLESVAGLAVQFLKSADRLISAALDHPDWNRVQPDLSWGHRVRAVTRKVRRAISAIIPILKQRR